MAEMSEVEDIDKMREIVKESLLKIFKEKFKELVPTCENRINPLDDDAICAYNMSSPNDCRFSTCPRLDLSPSWTAGIERDSNSKRRGKL